MKAPDSQPEVEQIFEDDELNLIQPHALWTREELLAKEGIFFLKDVADILELDSTRIKRRAIELRERGIAAWREMGVKKIWNHWVIRMKVFAPYYREHFRPLYRRIDKSWDANTLLEQEDVFLLADVVKLLPFTDHQLRYQAKKKPEARETIGIWKDEKLGQFLIDMPVFSRWVKRLWGEDGPPEDTPRGKRKRR